MTWGVLARDHQFLYVDGFTTTQPCPDKLSSSDDAESNGLYAAVCKAKELYDKEKLESGSDGVFIFIFSDSLANLRAFNKGIFQHYFGRDVKINPELTNQCRKHLGLALWASERKLDTSGNKPAMHSRIVVSYIPKNFNKIADFFSKVKLEEGLHMKYKEAHLTNKVKNLLVRERNLPAWRLILEKAEINAEKEKQKANGSGQKGKQQPLPVWVEKGDGKKHKIAEGSEEKIEGSERGKKKILDEENKRSVQKEKVHGGWMWKEKAGEGKKKAEDAEEVRTEDGAEKKDIDKIAECSEEKIEGSERGKKKKLDESGRSVQKNKRHGGWMWKEKADERKKMAEDGEEVRPEGGAKNIDKMEDDSSGRNIKGKKVLKKGSKRS